MLKIYNSFKYIQDVKIYIIFNQVYTGYLSSNTQNVWKILLSLSIPMMLKILLSLKYIHVVEDLPVWSMWTIYLSVSNTQNVWKILFSFKDIHVVENLPNFEEHYEVYLYEVLFCRCGKYSLFQVEGAQH